MSVNHPKSGLSRVRSMLRHIESTMFATRIGRISYILGTFYLLAMIGAYIIYADLLIAAASYLPTLKGAEAIIFVIIVGSILYLINATFAILEAICMISLLVRRLHDVNLTGWLWPILFIPGADLVLMFVIIFKPGTAGINKYGMPMRDFGLLKVLGFK